MKPSITLNGRPLTEARGLDEFYEGELDQMVTDTLDQLEGIRHNETVDRAPEQDLYGVDTATD